MLPAPTRYSEKADITISATGMSATTAQRSSRWPTVVEIVGHTKSLPETAAQTSGIATTRPIALHTT